MKKWFLAVLSVAVLPALTFAQEGNKNWQVLNKVKVEYDDNIRQESTDEDNSVKIIEELEFHVNMNLEQSVVTLRYRPSFVYWFDRDEDDTDFHHSVDALVSHRFSPALTVTLKDTFRFQELPGLIERGLAVREVNDYIYNDFSGSADMGLSANSRLILAGRYLFIDYDEADVASREDLDLFTLGASLDKRLSPQTAARGELRYEDSSYDTEITRDSTSYYLGGAVEHTFNPGFLGDLRAGWQQKDIDGANDDSVDSPYIDASVTFLPTPATRFSAGVGFSQFEANVYPYSNQERLRGFVSYSRDFTARMSWYNTLSLTASDYDSNQVSADALSETDTALADGSEDIVRFGTRLSYRLNRSNWLEAGYSLLTFDSDVRNDFDRNRVNVGWKTKL